MAMPAEPQRKLMVVYHVNEPRHCAVLVLMYNISFNSTTPASSKKLKLGLPKFLDRPNGELPSLRNGWKLFLLDFPCFFYVSSYLCLLCFNKKGETPMTGPPLKV